MKTTKRQWTTGALALMLATGGASSARAQADDNGPPPPPPGAPQAMPPGGGNRGGARRTPEQMQAQRAQMLKKMLEGAGITDEKTQAAVADYAADRETAARALQEKMRAVNVALRNGAATDQEIAASLANLRSAVAAEKTRRVGAEKDLDAEIGFSKKPRLDAMLTTMGLIGDEAAIANGGGGMRGGPGGRGAGGRNGGPRRNDPNGPPPPDGAPGDE